MRTLRFDQFAGSELERTLVRPAGPAPWMVLAIPLSTTGSTGFYSGLLFNCIQKFCFLFCWKGCEINLANTFIMLIIGTDLKYQYNKDVLHGSSTTVRERQP